MSMTSDEVNYLVYRYLQESGFSHSAFTFAYESQVAKSNVVSATVPPGALISFIQKGLQYVGIEAHVNEDGTERECDGELSLLSPHICQLAQSGSRGTNKRKRKSQLLENKDTNNLSTHQDGLTIRKDEITFLVGHTAEVFRCVWNPVTDILGSCSGDSTARIWSIPMESETPIVLQHKTSESNTNSSEETSVKRDVTTIEWNGDGSLLASGSYDGVGRVWSKTGELKQTLNKHQGPVFSLKWNKSSTLLLSGSFDNSAIVWDPETGEMKRQYQVHTAPTLDVDWKDDTVFATCSTDKTIKLCTLEDTQPFKTLTGHTDEVNTIKWNPSGTLLASCSDDHTVKLWNSTSESFVHDFRDHQKEIYTIKWSPTGPNTANPNGSTLLASASFDSTIKLWDIETGKCIYSLKHNDSIYSVAFSPNGDYLASGAMSGVLSIWSTKTGTIVKSYHGPDHRQGDIYDVDWNATGDKLAACFSDNNVCIVNFRS